jgi:hypothetical protein
MIKPSEDSAPSSSPKYSAGLFQAIRSRKLRPFVLLPILLFLFFISLVLLANSLVQKPSVQKAVLDRLSGLTGYQITLDSLELYMWNGLGIKASNFEARQKEGFGTVRASEAVIFVDALQLLKGRVVPRSLHVSRPVIDLAPPEESGSFPIVVLPGLDTLTTEKGSLFIRHFPIRFVNLNLEMKKAEAGALNVRCQGEARFRKESAPFRFQGVITQEQKREKAFYADLSLETGKMPLGWIPFPEELPVKKGTCEAKLRIEAKSNEAAKVNGKILVDSPRFSVRHKGRTKDYSLKFMTFDFRSFVGSDKIHVPHLNFKTPNASFSVNLRLDLQDKENPYLRLEAQSLLMTYSTVESLFPAPLVASWVEGDLFPILLSGDVQLESFLIDGRILQLKNLEFPENTSALSMGFDCRNFTVHGERLREPLKDVSAKVTLKDGGLLVDRLKGVSGKSQIRDGRLEVRDIYLPHPVFEPWVQGAFDLEDVLHQCKADFLPAGIREASEKTESVSGVIEGQARFKVDPLMEFPEIIEADFLLHEGSFKQKQWPFRLVLTQGRIRIGEENDVPPGARADGEEPWPQSRGHFQASGSWGASSFDAEGNFSLQGLSIDPRWMEVKTRLDLGQVWPALSRDGSAVVIKGSALCKSSIKKDGNLWSFKGTASTSGLSMDHELFRIEPPGKNDRLTYEIDLVPEQQIRIGQLLWETGKSQLNLSGDYPLSAESDITVLCSAPSLSLDDLALQFMPGNSVPRGSLKGRLQAKVPKNDFFAATVSGEMQGENLSFQVASLPSPVQECSFTALLSGDKIAIPSFTMTTGESSLKGSGELKGWKGLKGTLAVTSSPLNLSDFVIRGRESREPRKRSSFVDNTDIRVSLEAQPIQWRKLDFEKLKAHLLFRTGDIHIVNSEIQIDRGSLEVTGYVKEGAMAFAGHVGFRDQPVETLLKRLGIEPLYEGKLTMEARLYTEGKEWSDLIPHMDGGTNILISKGIIRKSNVFLKILDFLSLQNIFTKRPPDLSKEGLYFESLGGHGDIQQGVVLTQNAQMKSPVLNAVATGSADLGKGLADFDLGVQPLGTIDTVVSNIPVLGHILTGENKSLITYYFEVKGPILNPQVEAVPFKALGNGVSGILKRLFLSPVELFGDISEGIQKLPSPEHDLETQWGKSGGPGP